MPAVRPRAGAPTPYPGVNAVVQELLSRLRPILGDGLAGLYLHGSLASGDFDPESSDIDFLVVTRADLPDGTVAALGAMHADIAALGSRWATELEGSYIPKAALRRYDAANARHPRLDRYGTLQIDQHDSDWVIQRQIIWEQGVTVVGPDPRDLIDAAGPDDLRAAALATLREWWEPMARPDAAYNPILAPDRLRDGRYKAYAVLTMCRILYTLEYGAIASKPAAARWAEATLPPPWPTTIERALAGRATADAVSAEDALNFVQYVVGRSGADLKPPVPGGGGAPDGSAP